jgi:ribosome-binding factor A
MPFRAEQVAERIKEELADIIRLRMSDPRVGFVTITGVKVSDDLTFARVYVSEIPVEGKPAGQSVKALQHATGFLRSELGKRMRLRQTPELRFLADTSIEAGIRMTTLLDDLAKEGQAGQDDSGQHDDT